MKIVRKIVWVLYALVLGALVWLLGWLLQPIVVAHPIVSLVVTALVLLAGAPVCNALSGILTAPIVRSAKRHCERPFAAGFALFLCYIASAAVPWLRGVAGFGVWEWCANIAFTLALALFAQALCMPVYRCDKLLMRD